MEKIRLQHIQPDLRIGRKVAIVGSSAILLKDQHGAAIDAHDEVIRFNRAPVEGFENHVGSRTTIRTANIHVFANIPFDRWDPKGQPADFMARQKNCKLIYVGPRNHDWYKKGVREMHPSSKPYQLNRNRAKLHLRKEIRSTKDPSVGLILTWLCINSGIRPNLYGFGIEETEMTHYWEKRDNKTPYHAFSPERELLKSWHKRNKIDLHY